LLISTKKIHFFLSLIAATLHPLPPKQIQKFSDMDPLLAVVQRHRQHVEEEAEENEEIMSIRTRELLERNNPLEHYSGVNVIKLLCP
jgi:hypothetical protein